MFKSILGIIGGFTRMAGEWLVQRGRSRDRESGANRANLKHTEDSLEASREMREIENEVEGLPDDARRDLARRWVRGSKTGNEDDG